MYKNSTNKHYKIKVINDGNGVASISLVGGNLYNMNNKTEPKGKVFGPFKEKYYKRGTILTKLRIWGSGQNLMQDKRQK